MGAGARQPGPARPLADVVQLVQPAGVAIDGQQVAIRARPRSAGWPGSGTGPGRTRRVVEGHGATRRARIHDLVRDAVPGIRPEVHVEACRHAPMVAIERGAVRGDGPLVDAHVPDVAGREHRAGRSARERWSGVDGGDSAPSGMPSPSVSADPGFRPRRCSARLARPSPSLSSMASPTPSPSVSALRGERPAWKSVMFQRPSRSGSSRASRMPSPSVSALRGCVPADCSRRFEQAVAIRVLGPVAQAVAVGVGLARARMGKLLGAVRQAIPVGILGPVVDAVMIRVHAPGRGVALVATRTCRRARRGPCPSGRLRARPRAR